MRKAPKRHSHGSLLQGRTSAAQPSGNGTDALARHGETLLEDNHRSDVFEQAPVSLWEEDFSEIKRRLDSLKRSGVEDLRRHFRKHPEEVLSLARMAKVVRVNKATLDLYEAKGVEEFREGLSLVFSKESYDVFKEELIAFWKGKTLFSSEATNLTLSGERKDMLIRVAIPPGFEESWSRVFVAITDVTNLKEGIEGLRASSDKYRKVFATAHTPMMIVDHGSGVIVEVNDNTGRLLGLASSEVVGRHFTELFSPEGRERARAVLGGHGKEASLSSGNFNVQHGSGRSIPVSVTAAAIETAGTRLVSVCLREDRDKPALREVTGRKALQREKLLRRITKREREILRLIAGGHTNRAIGEKLQISEKTVETHRSRMMQKLDIHRLADLVRFALAAGLSP